MIRDRKKGLVLSIILFASISSVTTISTQKKYKNLKVLPQDIPEKQLDSIMNAYTKALKVECNFCHEPQKKEIFSIITATNEIDYSLDSPMKENARKMIRLTIDINKNYFYYDSLVKPEYLNVVSCNTCHIGNPYPVNEYQKLR